MIINIIILINGISDNESLHPALCLMLDCNLCSTKPNPFQPNRFNKIHFDGALPERMSWRLT